MSSEHSTSVVGWTECETMLAILRLRHAHVRKDTSEKRYQFLPNFRALLVMDSSIGPGTRLNQMGSCRRATTNYSCGSGGLAISLGGRELRTLMRAVSAYQSSKQIVVCSLHVS